MSKDVQVGQYWWDPKFKVKYKVVSVSYDRLRAVVRRVDQTTDNLYGPQIHSTKDRILKHFLPVVPKGTIKAGGLTDKMASIHSQQWVRVDQIDPDNVGIDYASTCTECECGADKVYGNVDGTWHSNWCPKFVQPKVTEDS